MPTYTMDIGLFIRHLTAEMELGATTITLNGKATLISNRNNAVLMTTEPQI